MRGLLATGLKQLPTSIDQMLMPDIWEIIEHWDQWPPEHVLLRGFCGYKPPEPVQKPVKELDLKASSQLAQYFGPAQKSPDHVNDLVRWAEEMNKKLGVKRGQS